MTDRWAWILIVLLLTGVAAADDPPAEQRTPPAESPIGRFLDRLFQGVNDSAEKESGDAPRPAQQQARPESTPPEIDVAQQIELDAIDNRAPLNGEQQRDLELARRMLAAGERADALTMLQQLLEGSEDTLILNREGHWESLHETVEQIISSGEPELKSAYVNRFGVQSTTELRQAKRSGNLRELALVTRRYLHTPAGREAALILAARFHDLGELAEAEWWTRRAARFQASDGSDDRLEPSSWDAHFADRAPETDAWLQPFGGPRHQGRAPAAEPIVIERWSQPIAVRPAIAEQVERLTQDLVDSGRACLPAAIPLAVDGKLITRTLRGVSVFEAETGKLLWETAEGVSVERLLSGEETPQPGGEPSGRNLRMVPAYRGTNPDAQPLTGLLFRDGVYGQLSSDGDQLFVLENHATLSYRQPGYYWSQRQADDPFERDWASNRLTAYDLETGTVRWRIGGEELDEPFDPPLVGTLFLGPPVVDRDELFLIGEQGKSLYLFCLDRRTGRPLWSHPISEAGIDIEQDLVRRWWPAQPAVGAGVIICPTTQGWLVAVDRLEHRIRWAYRYIEARQKKVRSNRSRVASAGVLNSRWAPAAPVLTDRYVVFTPPELPDPLYGEKPMVVCVDVLTGERVWREPKDSQLALGGVAGGKVLLVGKERLEARAVDTGKRLWETPFNLQKAGVADEVQAKSMTLFGEAGPPSGRGLIAGEEYLMPLQSGQLWFIDLASGEVRRTMALRSDDRPLGNLLVYRGHLFSVGPLSVRSFEKRASITPILAGNDTQAMTAAARLRAAELQSTEGDFAAARETLNALSVEELSAPQQRRRNDLLWDTLVQLVRNDLEGGDPEIDELEALADTDGQRLTVERLRADRLLAQGEPSAAFNVYWEHARTPRQVMVTEQETSLRFDRWLAGRLQTLWETVAPEDRRVFDQRIVETVDRVLEDDDESLSWWAEVLRFHPSGARLPQQLAEQALAEEHWAAGEIHLRQILEADAAPEVRTWAGNRLTQLLLDQQRDDDALATLKRADPELSMIEGIDASLAAQLPEETSLAAPRWSEGKWTLLRSPASYNRSMYEPTLAIAPGVPSVSRMKLRVEPNIHRLAIETLSGERVWETPLRSQSQSFYNNQTTGVAAVGQLLFVVHRGVLHALSVPDRTQLWRQPFDLQSASAGFVRGPSLIRQQELRTADHFVWSDGLRQIKTPLGLLAVWRPGYVAYFGRHTLTVADPLTGETFWTRRGIRPRTMVYGTSRRLYVVPPSPEKPYALRVLDGVDVELPQLASLASSAIGVTEEGLVVLREQQPLKLFGWGKRITRMTLIDPASGEERWELEFPDETRFARTSDEEILAVTPAGEVRLVDCSRGRQRTLGQVEQEAINETQRWFVVAEGDRLYLALNRHPKPGSYSRSYQAAPVNGTLCAFDRQDGLLWSETVEEQNLVVDQLTQLPVLVFTAQRPERNSDVSSQQVFVELRDKETGELLLDEACYITGGNVREMTVDHARQLIDLKTYRDRLRLRVADE